MNSLITHNGLFGSELNEPIAHLRQASRQIEQPTNAASCEIQTIIPESPYLERIIEIADANSGTLGLFPPEAFRESASRSWLFAAISKEGVVKGYILYFVARHRAKLQHLCVRDEWRGKGVTRKLIDELVARTKHLYGIELHCRRDYPAHAIWPKLGFVAESEKRGRGRKNTELTRFWLDNDHPYLSDGEAPSAKPPVVIDTMVVCDIANPDGDRESRAVKSDWLQAEFRLSVVPEVFNEINRCSSRAERERFRNAARQMHNLKPRRVGSVQIYKKLCEAIGPPRSEGDKSDYQQIAQTIANDVGLFVTRDTNILRHTATGQCHS